MNRSRRLAALLLTVLAVATAACSVSGGQTTPTASTSTSTSTSASTPIGAQGASTGTPVIASVSPASTVSPTPDIAVSASPTPGPATPAAPAVTPAASPDTATDIGAALGARAMDTVRHLAGTIGSRPAGSAAERRAAEWLQQQLAGLGYQATLQTFPVRSFEDNGASLEIQTPEPRSIPTENLNYGGSGDISGQVIYASLGRPGEFPAEVRGQIALVDRGDIGFQAKADNALAAGAVGLIVANNQPGDLNGTLASPASIPVVAISQADGQALRQLVQRETVTAHLVARTRVEETNSQNVVATQSRPNLPIIIVGGHYDSVPAGPGANDNASGTAAALEVARALVGETRAEVRYVAFGAEETGLNGSRAYVDTLSQEERRRIILMVNLDMVGVGDRFMIGGSAEFAGPAVDLARQSGIASAQPLNGGRGSSDHQSFISAGIPALFLHWFDDPNYHTAGDLPEEVRPELIADAARLALAMIDTALKQQG